MWRIFVSFFDTGGEDALAEAVRQVEKVTCAEVVVVVRRRSGSSGTSITTDRIRLRMSRFTALVKTTGAQTFIVDNLPGLFANATPPITEIEVRTSSQTDFDGVANAASLAIGNRVSLRGLLFRRLGGSPSLVAKKVRLRP